MTELAEEWIRFRLLRIPPIRFESLCCDLLSATGHTEIRHWGAKGREGGYDILSRDPSGRLFVTQCKRVQKLSESGARLELEKMIRRAPDPPPAVALLAATCEISRDVDNAWKDTAKTADFDLEIEPAWAIDTFVRALLEDESLRRRYVGRAPEDPVPFWNVPARNTFFTGREELLEGVAERLDSDTAVGLTQAIVGLGGIGKTQTAIEYAHRYQGRYTHVFWVDAAGRTQFEASTAEIARALDLVGKDAPTEDAAEVFLSKLPTLEDWLLVLDNADEPEELPEVTTRTGHILITSRRSNLDRLNVKEPIRVEVLDPDEALELVLQRSGRGPSEAPAARGLVEALGFFPLAIEQAGAFLRSVPVPIEHYRADLEKRRLEAVEQASPITGRYEHTVASTWSISFEKVREASFAAAEALEVMAFLAPDKIPLELFERSAAKLGPNLERLATRREQEPAAFFVDVVEVVERYSLARFDLEEQDFSVHRLVQAVLRADLEDAGQSGAAFDRAIEGLAEWLPTEATDPAGWPLASRALPHLRATLVLSEGDVEIGTHTAALWSRGGWLAWAMGAYREAEILETRALEASERILGPEHPETLSAKANLAYTLRALGKASEARPLEETALEASERILGSEHPNTLITKANLAQTLGALGEEAEARPLYEAALEVSERTLGSEHPDTLTIKANLAYSLRGLGKAAEALPLFEAVLEARERILGSEHPSTLTAKGNYAQTLGALGKASEAHPLEEAVVEASERILGSEHPTTLTAKGNLAQTLITLGKASEARLLFEAVLEARERVLGPEHPRTKVVRNNLAHTLRLLGLDSEADALEGGG